MGNKPDVYAAAGMGIKVGGIGVRYFIYTIGFIVIYTIFILLSLMGGLDRLLIPLFGDLNMISATAVCIIILLLPFIFWERSVLKFRRKNGFSLYKNIEEELKQMAINERVAREKKAYEINNVNQDIDKSDLGYWHGLLKNGAITQAEYDAKKKELM